MTTSMNSSTSTGSRSSTSDLLKELISAQNAAAEETQRLLQEVRGRDQQLDELTKGLKALSERVEELASKPVPKPPAATGLSGSQIAEMTETLASAAEAAVAEMAPRLKVSGAQLAPLVGEAVAERTTEAARDVLAALDEAEERMSRSEARAAKLSRSLTVASLAKLGMAAIPFAVILAMLTLFTVPVAEIAGVGPLARWGWHSFEAATTAWGRAGIAALIFAVITLVCFGLYRGGRWLHSLYRGW